MRLATHNIKVDLPDKAAGEAVRDVLRREPDIFGIQEWGRSRASVLRQFGTVILAPKLQSLWRRYPENGYLFLYPRGGQPWGVDAAKYEVDVLRLVPLSRGREGVRPTFGTEIVFEPRGGGKSIAALNVHPVAHHDRPENRAAHAEAVDNILDWADDWDRYRRYVVGDFNAEHVEIPDLVSCWDGRRDQATGPGGGTIDEIYGPNGFASVEVIDTTSDHHAVVADEKEKP